MTGIIVAPDLGKVLVERRGIFTVPGEMATVSCWCPHGKPCQGVEIDKLPQSEHQFFLWAKRMGEMFIARQEPRGYEWAMGNLWLHGPFPSYEFNSRLVDIESEALRQAGKRGPDGFEHPEQALPLVFERDAFSPYMDYVFLGKFLFRDLMTDLEVPDGRDL